MNTPISSKLILRQIIRSCFSLCVSIGFVLNPFLAIAELEHSSYSMNLSNKEKINIKTSQKYLRAELKNNLCLKTRLVQKVYKNKLSKKLNYGNALTLSSTKFKNADSYNSIN